MVARHHEDGDTLVLKTDFETRDFLLAVNPLTYYITDHYKNYPYVLVRLSHVDLEELKGHIVTTWKSMATKKMIQESQLGN